MSDVLREKILLTGSSGVLGRYLCSVLPEQQLLAPSHQDFDLTNKSQMAEFFRLNRPTVLIHLAAMTNVDACERHPAVAGEINGQATGFLAELCQQYQTFMVYVSTAAVFSGEKVASSESDITDPVNVYGKSKLLGEQLIQKQLSQYLIIRSAWLIGGGKAEKKFISYIIGQAKTKSAIAVVNDKFGTITYAQELSELIWQLVKEGRTGLYHYGSRGVCSRYDIAQKVIDVLRLGSKLIPVSSTRFNQTFFAPRPTREVIISQKIDFPHTWQESLTDYLTNEILP